MKVPKLVSQMLCLATVTMAVQAQANTTCLNAKEGAELQSLETQYQTAVYESPDCPLGAPNCISSDANLMRERYLARALQCAVETESAVKISGDWSVVARVCEPSGNAGEDRFVLGRDTLILSIRQGYGRVTTTIDGNREVKRYRFRLSGNEIVFTTGSKDGKSLVDERLSVDMTDVPTLILTSGGFGERGTCKRGETLKSYFRKN